MPQNIVLSKFQGTYPEIAAYNLPDNAASAALNCDLRWGKILALPSMPVAQTLGGEVPDADLFLLRKAKMPVWASWSPVIAAAFVSGITLDAGVWLSAAKLNDDASIDSVQLEVLNGLQVAKLDLDYTVTWEPPNVIRISYDLHKNAVGGGPTTFGFGAVGLTTDISVAYETDFDVVPDSYSIQGPSFRVTLPGNAAVDGYPDATSYLGNLGPSTPGTLSGLVAIRRGTGDARKTVAYVSCADTQITNLADTDEPNVGATFHSDFIPASKGEIVLQVAFPYDKERSVYYAAAALYQNPDDIEDVTEGPLGYRQWVSDSVLGDPVEIVIPEGQRPQFTLALQTTPASSKSVTHMRVFRANQAARGWKRVEDVAVADWTPWTDDVLAPQGDEVLPYGNAPDITATFQDTTFILPGQFAAGYYNDTVAAPDTYRLYFSEVFAWHIWPEEYYLEFSDPIIKMVAVGGGLVLWTGVAGTSGHVYWVYGNSPDQMAYTLLSDAEFLQDTDAVCRDGAAVYYAAQSGIGMVSGGQLRILSEPFLSRTTYRAMTGFAGSLVIRAEEGIVWFGTAGASGVGYTLQPQLAGEGYALVPYNTGSTSVYWQSKEWQFDEPMNLANLHYLGGGGTVLLTFMADDVEYPRSGGSVVPLSVADKTIYPLASAGGTGIPNGIRKLSINVSGTGDLAVERLSLSPRVVIPVSDQPIRITPDMIAPDGTCWLQFVNAGRFRGGILNSKGGGTVTLTPRA